MPTLRHILTTTIPATAQAILKENGIDITPAQGQTPYERVAVIGFSGDGFGGSLGFFAERSLVDTVYGGGDASLSDGWLGEIANLLLGRLKNTLLAYGVEYRLAIPMVLHGLDIRVRGDRGQILQFSFSSKHGSMCVVVDATWEIDRELRLVDAEYHAKEAGECLLFEHRA